MTVLVCCGMLWYVVVCVVVCCGMWCSNDIGVGGMEALSSYLIRRARQAADSYEAGQGQGEVTQGLVSLKLSCNKASDAGAMALAEVRYVIGREA